MNKRSADAPFVSRKARTLPGDRTIKEVCEELGETRARIHRIIAVLGLPVSKLGIATLVGIAEFNKIRDACEDNLLRRGPRRWRKRPHDYRN